MFASAVAVLLIAAGPAGAAASPQAPRSADRTRAMVALPAGDADIDRALFEMLERDPERQVCSVRIQTGSRQPRTSCATLRAWFANRRVSEIRNNEAPWQLVEEIKQRRKKALLRSQNGG